MKFVVFLVLFLSVLQLYSQDVTYVDRGFNRYYEDLLENTSVYFSTSDYEIRTNTIHNCNDLMSRMKALRNSKRKLNNLETDKYIHFSQLYLQLLKNYGAYKILEKVKDDLKTLNPLIQQDTLSYIWEMKPLLKKQVLDSLKINALGIDYLKPTLNVQNPQKLKSIIKITYQCLKDSLVSNDINDNIEKKQKIFIFERDRFNQEIQVGFISGYYCFPDGKYIFDDGINTQTVFLSLHNIVSITLPLSSSN